MIIAITTLIIAVGFLTFTLSLSVHVERVDFYTNQDSYIRMAIRDALMWPVTFLRVIRDCIE